MDLSLLTLLLVAVGGALGALARYLVAGGCQLVAANHGSLFPYGTLVVNVVGCFCLGTIAVLLSERLLVSPVWRFAVTVGFFGAFTTFSTYGFETMTLLQDGQWRAAALNVLASNGVGLLAAWAGIEVGQRVL